MNTDNNKLIADFMGFQKTDIGWFDNEETLNLPQTQDNTFDILLFDVSWDWLIPVIRKISDDKNFLWKVEGFGIRNSLLYLNIEEVYEQVVKHLS